MTGANPRRVVNRDVFGDPPRPLRLAVTGASVMAVSLPYRPPPLTGPEPGQGRHDHRLGASVQGGLDDRSELRRVVNRDVLRDPPRPPPPCGTDPDRCSRLPSSCTGCRWPRDVAEVFTGGLLAHRFRPVAEEVGEGASQPLRRRGVVVGQWELVEELELRILRAVRRLAFRRPRSA